jgi:lysophospholipase L1-like esterase
VKTLARRTTTSAIALALALVLANEVADRWLPVPAQLFRADPVVLHANVPGAHRVIALAREAGGGWVKTEIDRDGFRGRELARPKRGARVYVAGDSLVLAESVAFADTFVEQLGGALAAEGTHPEMINGGVSGYGPDQAWLALERQFDALRPDLVVLVLCAHNDLGDLVRNKLFRLGSAGELVRNTPRLAPALLADFAEREHASRSPALVRLARRAFAPRKTEPASATPPPYMEWYLAAARDEHTEFVLERSDVVRSLFEDYYDADVAITPDAPSAQFKRELMRKLLAHVAAECRRRGVPCVALVVPSAVDLCRGLDIRIDPAAYPSWSSARLTESFDALLAEAEVPFVDLAPVFRAADAETLFRLPHDFHWSAAGQALAAREMAAFLRARSLWPPARVR